MIVPKIRRRPTVVLVPRSQTHYALAQAHDRTAALIAAMAPLIAMALLVLSTSLLQA